MASAYRRQRRGELMAVRGLTCWMEEAGDTYQSIIMGFTSEAGLSGFYLPGP